MFLEGFEFASAVDEAVALMSLFAAVERRLMDSAPGMAVIAASQSSGKTTLALRLHALLTGRPMPTWTIPVGDDSEIEKRLLGILLAAPEMVCFDNVPDGLTVHCGPALNSAMTSPIFECRMLGANRNQQAPTNVFWVITGNNLRLGADETTRLLQTRLAPAAHRPETRTFKNPDVLQHALSIRSEVLQHVVGIVAGYLLTDARVSGGTRFPQWDRLARQPLLWAGGCNPLQAFDTNYEQAEHLQSLRVLLREMYTLFEGETFAARDVVNEAPVSVRDALEGLQCRNASSVRSVGRVLAAVIGRVSSVGGETLSLTDSVGGRNAPVATRCADRAADAAKREPEPCSSGVVRDCGDRVVCACGASVRPDPARLAHGRFGRAAAVAWIAADAETAEQVQARTWFIGLRLDAEQHRLWRL